MLRRSALAVGALLGGFHLWLLGNQAWTGQLAEPDVVLRWAAALALGAGVVVIKRRGETLFGRTAVAIWVLAALLHGPALANDLDGFATPSLPETVATLGQVAVSALALTLLTLLAVAPGHAPARYACVVLAAPFSARGRAAATDPGFLPRPPPRA